jgi:antitoxin (DNA-binding transcriptional repressor) of toxin-antitoxin stability system
VAGVRSALLLTVRAKRANRQGVKTVSVRDAKTQFFALLAELEAGRDRIVICRNGIPVADLIAHQGAPSMDGDPKLGALTLCFDPTEELSDEEWPQTKP